jgi:Family of unknown function (DUF5681)
MPSSDAFFQPGQSGNPGGRPKTIGWLRDLAREQTEAALHTLVEIATGKGELLDKDGHPVPIHPSAARVAAANSLLDRGWGKAPATESGEGGEGALIRRIERHIVDPRHSDAPGVPPAPPAG